MGDNRQHDRGKGRATGAGVEVAVSDSQQTNEPSLHEALKLFELHPDFARVQVRMRERIAKASRNLSADARRFGMPASS
jgi:hypothetical protein